MRIRVDYEYGYASFDESERERAEQFYEEHNGIRMRLCRDLFDEGEVIRGRPLFEDHTDQPWVSRTLN